MKPYLMIETLEGRRLFAATLDPASPGAQPVPDTGGGLVTITADSLARLRAAPNIGQNIEDGLIPVSFDGETTTWVKPADVVYTSTGLKLASDVAAGEGLPPPKAANVSVDATPIPDTGGGLVTITADSLARLRAAPNIGQTIEDGLSVLPRQGGKTFIWVKSTDVVYTPTGLKLASDLEEDTNSVLA